MNKASTILKKLKSKCFEINNKRNENTDRYKMTNLFSTLFFPVFIVLMAELNQDKYPSKLILFISQRPMVMLFNIIVAAVIFAALCLLFKKVWRAVAVQGIVYFMLSITELFKFGTNGNHLIMTDMKLVKSVKSLTSFAYIKITPVLVCYTLIVLIYIGMVFWFNPCVKLRFSRRIVPAAVCMGSVVSLFFVPKIASPVYSLFDVDTTAADNVFILNEKFNNNSFLAFFMQTASENISNKLEKPQDYNEEVIDEYLDVPVINNSTDSFIKPNVVTVMSEACADFRVFDQLDLDTDAYYGFDRLAKEGYKGDLIVPTFASYTVRTEFELLFGLPVKSLNDPSMPQRMLSEEEQPTIAQYYKKMGYNTAYVHPFLSSFYSRGRLYKYFGFDQMYFEDSLTVPVEYNNAYIKDSVVFDQAEKIINESDEPVYIHATTMQNHQPYTDGPYDNELDNYLSNIKLTSDAINDLIDDLSKSDEPTVLFIVGDHFPSFKKEGSVYEQLGINSETCDIVFDQSFYIWSNYDLDYSQMPDEKFSAFYVPYVMLDLIGAPKDTFTQAMLEKMQTVPIYSTQYDSSIPNDDELDILTYDRAIGDKISKD
ncbi:MAG: sulfatase-like hydrolase/transferase [Oscillospiraceae bacterium]|nr:sulfatase-like hydrolase/transferase [Oscillospiraceae bacterium]